MGSRAGGQWLVGWEDGLVGGLCRREFQGLAIRVAQRFVLDSRCCTACGVHGCQVDWVLAA